MITIEDVKNLRSRTGVSIMQCKKALEASNGDFNKALEELKTKGAEIASKKSERELKSGIIQAYVHNDKKTGSILELLCETDFVAKNEDFQKTAHDIVMHITAMNPENKEELLAQSFIKDSNKTINQLIEENIQRFGENIEIGYFIRYSIFL